MWGICEIDSTFDNDKRISLLLVNSESGNGGFNENVVISKMKDYFFDDKRNNHFISQKIEYCMYHPLWRGILNKLKK